ncbi:DnaJ domain containing protein [Striga asiatica]|uniref:DnaJ domain containing protein n=1 Tax=Striga asiatica TaxID=4170 RepID=A0A5A7PGH2_STRAF|nr:DnaJ domain containing protein [Striga asiatica]
MLKKINRALMGDISGTTYSGIAIDDDLLLKKFFAEVSEIERDNEVNRGYRPIGSNGTWDTWLVARHLPVAIHITDSVSRILSRFKLNAFEYLNLPFDSSVDVVKRQYRKFCLWTALAKAQQLLLDPQERDYILNQVTAAKVVMEQPGFSFSYSHSNPKELRAKRKNQLKKDTATKIKSLVDEGKYEQEYEISEEFQQQLKLKVGEILTDQEWRRRMMQMMISEEEGRLNEEETKEMWKRKREHEEQWEGTREQRVSSWRDFMKGGKKVKKGELRPPKLKTEDANKSYVQMPVKRG